MLRSPSPAEPPDLGELDPDVADEKQLMQVRPVDYNQGSHVDHAVGASATSFTYRQQYLSAQKCCCSCLTLPSLEQAFLKQHDEVQLGELADQEESLLDSTANAVEIYGLQKLFRRPTQW